MKFIYFLISKASQNEVYGSWYMEQGCTLGIIVSAAIALAMVLLFYYLWSRLKPVTTFHWLITMVLDAAATLFAAFFIAKGQLVNYITINGLDQADPTAFMRVSSGTIDMWLFGINTLMWGIVFYFVFSVVLKTWSTSYNIPFGRGRKK